MRAGYGRANLFLIEITCNLFIFALCAAVCVGLLVHARAMSWESTRLTQAVYLAQSTAEALRVECPVPTAPDGYEIDTRLKTAEGGLTYANIEILNRGESVYTLETKWMSREIGSSRLPKEEGGANEPE